MSKKSIELIKSKGFDMDRIEGANTAQALTDYGKIKINSKTLDNGVLDVNNCYKKTNPRLGDKATVMRAINNYDLVTMREISDFFYKTSGIYSRILRYMAFMYRYDWMVTPYVNTEEYDSKKILEGFYKCLNNLDKFQVKKTFGEIALKILRHGAYYGYKVEGKNGTIVLQELPVNYCRSRWSDANLNNKPVVEFNMKYFDDYFSTEERMKVLKAFPPEFAKGYVLYKQNKLPATFKGDTSGWYMLDVENTVRFTANGEEHPAFISVIPLILDLDQAQEVNRKKAIQQLLKIVIQKMPLDKDGELIFDIEEAQQLHNNAVRMLADALGVKVLTTFADVDVADMSETAASAQADDLEKAERQLYNEAGVSQMQFNTDGNIALEKSILNDEATMYNMLLQFEGFLNELIEHYSPAKKKLEYRVQLLTTTIYNYKELSKLYKEQTQLGYSKMLPQIALGQSQSSILANAYFENDVLDLVNLFIPPLMSSTMNPDMLKTRQAMKNGGEEKTAGRKELADDQKSEKTLKNLESAN